MKFLRTIAVSLFFLVSARAQEPIGVVNTLTNLLTSTPTYGQTVVVLGQHSLFDVPIRLAKHFTNVAYAIDNITVYPAVGGGIWKLLSVGSGTGSSVYSIGLLCPDDGTIHDVGITKVDSFYTLTVSQAPSIGAATPLILNCPSDGSNHQILINLDSETGFYQLEVYQTSTLSSPTTLTMVYSDDSSSHLISLYTDSGFYGLFVQQ